MNTKETISQQRKDEIVDEFSLKLLRSGYSTPCVRQIIISGLRGFLRKVSNAKQSGVSLHRSAQSTLEARIKKKLTEKSAWFKGNSKKGSFRSKKHKNIPKKSQNPRVVTVMFVPRTNNSKLCKILRAEEEKLTQITGYKCAIKERNGTQIRRILVKKNPFILPCGRESCLICKGGEPKADCRRRNIVYMTTCESCVTRNAAAGVENTPENVAHYVGEAARSPAERSAEHLQDLKDKKEESHMWSHKLLEHPDEDEINFSMKVLKKHSSAFQRQVMEAVVIEMRQNGNILNSRSGYNRCLIPRLSVSVGDRVQEEIVRKADYNPADVDKILAAERCKKNVRHRTDDDEDKDGEAKIDLILLEIGQFVR